MLKWILAGAPYVSCDSGGGAPQPKAEKRSAQALKNNV